VVEDPDTRRIRKIIKAIALTAIDTMLALEKYPTRSMEYEQRVMSLWGYMRQLIKQSYKVWRKSLNKS